LKLAQTTLRSKTMTTPRKRTTKTDKEVAIGSGIVSDKTGVHGTPSNTEKSRTGAYAASSVIHRGTADTMRADVGEGEKHLCVCGCGQTPSLPSSLFMPGHDSKVRAMGKAVLEGKVKETALPKIARNYLHEGGML
jgi:hypothetical protein